jgi:hypothetical protein
MIITPFIALVLASTSVFGQAQVPIVYDQYHNATPITGTWSSGSQAVQTGPGFANPAKETFTYPPTTGISYSFTPDGYYEISRYRFNSNGSQPTCIIGVVVWVHGVYTLNPNGSITMVPFGDGFQQVQDPCGAVSNFIQNYNDTEYYQSWQIFMDPVFGPKLHLFQFDGSPLAPQFQSSATPNMLPTQLLRNVTPSAANSQQPIGGLTSQGQGDFAVNAAQRPHWNPSVLIAGGAVLIGVLSLVV